MCIVSSINILKTNSQNIIMYNIQNIPPKYTYFCKSVQFRLTADIMLCLLTDGHELCYVIHETSSQSAMSTHKSNWWCGAQWFPISLGTLSSNLLASNFYANANMKQAVTSRPQLPVTNFFGMLGCKLCCLGGINAWMSVVSSGCVKYDVFHLLPMCHVWIEVRL
jgi:hypothetical protein